MLTYLTAQGLSDAQIEWRRRHPSARLARIDVHP
jgi:hypothetical protein